MATVTLRSLYKNYGDVEVVHGIDLEVAHQEFIVLVGPSGCGKSTTLRMIAGLEDITAGEIWIDDTLVNEVEPQDRDIAMVFQDYALYPHMSVYQNMAFSLQYRGHDKADIRRRVTEAADVLNISELMERRPKQLSGGQRQRVAMGRAMVRDPKVFLFDEPLSNLDAKLRVSMRGEIKKLHRRVSTTSIYVTHDQVEAMTLADRIVIMNEGNIEQIGTPDEVYSRPTSVFVAGFVGSPTMNLLPAELSATDDGLTVDLDRDIRLPVPQAKRAQYADYVGRRVVFGLRPENIRWSPNEPTNGAVIIRRTANEIEPLGSDTLVFFSIGDREVVGRLPPNSIRRIGETFTIRPEMDAMQLFDPDSGKVI